MSARTQLPIRAAAIYVECFRRKGDMLDQRDKWLKTLVPGRMYVIDLSSAGEI